MFYDQSKIRAIHLEITDRCNASCPQCVRNILGGKENPHLPKRELSLDDIKKIITPKIVHGLERLYMCGNFGDPVVAKDTLEAFHYFRESNSEIHLSMNTNGAMRPEQWWRELAKVFGRKGNIKFALDGLKGTHELYRVGTDFDKVLRNAKAFIDAGGEAVWEFIVFRHNKHQIEDARKLSESLGFSRFQVKKTGRFFSNKTHEVALSQEVLNTTGEVTHHLELPEDESLHNPAFEEERRIVGKFGSMDRYFDSTKISCKVEAEGSVYVSSEGLVFPCCWVAMQPYSWYRDPAESPVSKLLENCGGSQTLNAHQHSIQEIVNGAFFKGVKESWSCSSIADGKLRTCAKTCGDAFDQFSSQYK